MRFPESYRLSILLPDTSGDNDKAVERQLFDKLVKKALHDVKQYWKENHNMIYMNERSVGAAFPELSIHPVG